MVTQALAALVDQLRVAATAVIRGRVSARPCVEISAELAIAAVGREDAVCHVVDPLELGGLALLLAGDLLGRARSLVGALRASVCDGSITGDHG